MAVNKPIQISEFLNPAVAAALGKTVQEVETLSWVDMGTAIFSDLSTPATFLNNLVYGIGNYVFVNRKYNGIAPDLKRYQWEYNYLLSKISFDLTDAQDNPMYELRDGMTIEQNKFTQSSYSAKYFGKYTTWEIPLSIPQEQLKGVFKDQSAMEGFIAGLMDWIDKSLTVREDKLVLSTISNMIGEVINADYGSSSTSLSSGVRAKNVFYLYKQANPDTDLTAETCRTSADFQRFVMYLMRMDKADMKVMSTRFNVEGKPRFTDETNLRIAMLSEEIAASDIYLQSDTFHNEITAVPGMVIEFPYWQSPTKDSSGSTVDGRDTINIITSDGETVNQSGIIACMFDRDAVGIINHEEYVVANPVVRGHFNNYWFQRKAGYFNDLSENFIVYFVA